MLIFDVCTSRYFIMLCEKNSKIDDFDMLSEKALEFFGDGNIDGG